MRKQIDPEKLRDMTRSILPSRYRTGPRDEKALRKRDHRRKIRRELSFEDPECTAADVARDVHVEDIVQWRRGGDKLSHFLRWCERITDGMTVDDALGFVRGILPHTIVGDHAYSHREWHRKPNYFGGFGSGRSRERTLQSYRDSATFRLRRAMELDPSLHGRLNAKIKAAKMFEAPRRLLAGLHDVARFVEDVRPRPGDDPYASERSLMLGLIGEVEKGGHRAALRFDLVQLSRA